MLAGLADGTLTSEGITDRFLARVAELDGRLNAWRHVDAPGARAQARASDARRRGGQTPRPLEGVPIALKDLFVTRDLPTTCGSRILEGYLAPYEGAVVRRLRDAGAVLLGKLNMDEFAMGSSGENSAYGPTRNPWDTERVPGGSSSGSAAAVAAGLCAGAFGTDTGGSIRQPAAMCGVVGLKPTYGRVSRHGVIAFASSLDQVGPLGRSVDCVARLLGVVAGHDPHDATSDPRPVPDYVAPPPAGDLRGVRLGVPREYVGPGLDPEVGERVRAAVDVLAGLGATVEDVSLPHTDYALATYYLIATAEASSNLARYDGVRYGARRTAPGAADLRSMYERTRGQGFGREVQRRIMLGTYALSAGYYDAYYLKAQRVRTLIRRDFERAFAQVDALVTPVSPVTAFRIGERTADPLAMYLSDVYTIPSSLAGLPAMSVPCGFDARRLPVGLQVIGPPFAEPALLRIGRAWQSVTDHHRHLPPVA
jgi:aspartyl-tRNA(Asn)/glutamyl-tRNA(Gln) amidotransferase subunit A